MKERFNLDVTYTIDCILHGQAAASDWVTSDEPGSAGKGEALERSIACLAAAMEERAESVPKFGVPVSFKYVAASICLEQVQKFQGVYGFRRMAVE